MSALARLSLANRALVALISIAIVVFGFIATGSLRQELMPSLELPQATVMTTVQGASPEVVEERVSDPIETVVQTVDGVTDVTSTSSEGSSVVTATFDYGTDSTDAVREIQVAINRILPQLPEDAEPITQTISFDSLPVLLLAASADVDEAELAQRLEDQVVPALEDVPGVQDAVVTGQAENAVEIRPDFDALEDEGLTVDQIAQALQASGTTQAGGQFTEDGETLSVDVGGDLESVSDIEDLYLTPAAGAAGADPAAAGAAGAAGQPPGAAPPAAPEPVRLGDVAEVSLEPQETTTITRTDGEPSLSVMVTKATEANTVEVANAVKAELAGLEEALGDGAALTVVFDQAPFIEDSITGLLEKGAMGLVAAIAVILVFLLSVRSTVVTALSIPFSLLVALIGMWLGGYTLNILTLSALTIAIGRVVDDSIVVLENIKRHLGYGTPKREAVITGVREVAGAITASTITTAAVFLPVVFVGGEIGELFRPFGLTVAIALAASLLVSLTIIPVLAYWFVKGRDVAPEDLERVRREEHEKERRGWLQRGYVPLLSWVTKWRKTTLAAALAVFVGTLFLATQLQTNFLDDTGQNTVAISQELPAGTSLEETAAAAEPVEQALDSIHGVQSYQVTVGSTGGMGFGGGGGSNTATYTVTTDPEADQTNLRERIRDELDGIADAGELSIQDAAAMGSSAIEVQVQADDPEVLDEAATMVEDTVAQTDGVSEVANDLAVRAEGVHVSADREAAAEEGLSETQIGQAVQQAFDGRPAGSMFLDGAERDVVIAAEDVPEDLDALEDLEIATPAGGTVRLSEVAEVAVVDRPVEISRTDGERTATVSATPEGQDIGALTTALTERLDALDLPAGATYQIGGVSADQTEAFTQLGIALLAAVAIVYVVMVAEFKSLIQPLILLVSVPFAATGAIVGLLVTDTALGVVALIGLLMLVGIVVTNAIVLIDLINQYRERGMGIREAVVEGGRQRLRPILMTALATIGALVPMALGIGGSVLISEAMAIVVIGGLVSSTLLTLILVPVLYTMIEESKERRRDRRARRRAARFAAEGAAAAEAGRDPVPAGAGRNSAGD
ncbi:efflux RND transporter permease subunit [Allonocardiopsis opalescens]|uniref:HAE1 family hydrophobic/amphiphilic exporter-1 n=1 Tax=Allonocardiopsis opalescens TaxID=1144618 RepID=A0A2T0PUG1_9ACTN|nr:efflux RND transporter permease subunit [Allonocardiopsis opalescens]PRX92525.1 HAE1 family hydrophobic/amphiphilic exporter-1 [Allonocardiopsis opalescens]